MNTQHTPKLKKPSFWNIFLFAQFCKRHGLRFNNLTEYNSALRQYYSE